MYCNLLKKFKMDLSTMNLTGLKEMEDLYLNLCLEEEKVTSDLDTLYDQQSYLENKMINLHNMLPQLQLVQADTNQLSSMIGFTSSLAENVSRKVRHLDLAKSRVNDCMRRVEDILDVKFCTDGVQTALQNEDYEQAASHIHRFLSLDENVLKSTARNLSEGNTLDSSFSVLHEAKLQLQSTVIKKFDEAVRDEDLASVERFFKIFPLLNQHEEGLKKFALYLCSQISEKAQKNLQHALSSIPNDKRANIIFADALTLLFEGIARFIEINQPLIENYYGAGRLLTVVNILQKECDRQVKKIIDEFKKIRQFNSKIQQVQVAAAHQYRSNIETNKLDPREMDVLLGETALVSARSELYIRFIRRRLINDIEAKYLEQETRDEHLNLVEKLISGCQLSHITQDTLGHYIMMEEYFLRESVNKAISMDCVPTGSITSSAVDDVFFIVKKCIRRAMSTSSVDGVCAMLNNSCTTLEASFLAFLQTQLGHGFPSGGLDLVQAYNVIQSSLQAKVSTNDSERSKMSFLVALNNLEAASDYSLKLKKSLEEEIERHFSTISSQENGKLESCLSGLSGISNRFRSILDYGTNQLNTTVVRPRIRPWIETFSSVNHELNEEEFANYEVNDPFVQTLIVNLDNLLTSFKHSLSSRNYDGLVAIVTNEVVTQLEKVVSKQAYNRLGSLQFDKELRSLSGYLTEATTWSVRDKFSRLTQISTILNLEKVGELLDYWGANCGPVAWRLTPSEVRLILGLRVDFLPEDITRLKL